MPDSYRSDRHKVTCINGEPIEEYENDSSKKSSKLGILVVTVVILILALTSVGSALKLIAITIQNDGTIDIDHIKHELMITFNNSDSNNNYSEQIISDEEFEELSTLTEYCNALLNSEEDPYNFVISRRDYYTDLEGNLDLEAFYSEMVECMDICCRLIRYDLQDIIRSYNGDTSIITNWMDNTGIVKLYTLDSLYSSIGEVIQYDSNTLETHGVYLQMLIEYSNSYNCMHQYLLQGNIGAAEEQLEFIGNFDMTSEDYFNTMKQWVNP